MTGLVASGHPLVSQEFHNGGNRKRSHHSLVKDEVEEDELSDELSNPTEKKRRLTTDQVKFLEMSFSMDLKLEPERKALLAKKLGIRPRQVAIWFQNRRARWKNKQLEQDYENLKTNFESVVKEKEKLLAERESVLEQNKQLQAQVFHLSGLLERMRNSGSSDITTGTGSDGKSELTSPTKSSDDQGEVQDSGQSNCLSGGLEMDPVVPPIWELNPGLVCPYNIKSEAEHASIFSTDEFYGSNLTLLFHAPTVNGVFLEDGFYPNYEDQFGGLACQEYMVP